MSACPGFWPQDGNPVRPLHCPGCADDEHSWLPREYTEKVRENAQLRAQLAQRTDVLRALLQDLTTSWTREAVESWHQTIAGKLRTLADLPDAKEKP